MFNHHLGNIFSVYARADRWDREFGMNAYENYQAKIQEIVDGTVYDLQIGCGVLAALSPNIDEKNNFIGLVRLLRGNAESSVPGYPPNISKAKRIMEGKDPLAVLSGNKTRAFYKNLFRPWDLSNELVIDAHMYSIWMMKRHKVTSINITDKLYDQIAKDFTKVAVMLDLRPNQLQAICWSTWKRVHNIVFDSQLKLEL